MGNKREQKLNDFLINLSYGIRWTFGKHRTQTDSLAWHLLAEQS